MNPDFTLVSFPFSSLWRVNCNRYVECKKKKLLKHEIQKTLVSKEKPPQRPVMDRFTLPSCRGYIVEGAENPVPAVEGHINACSLL